MKIAMIGSGYVGLVSGACLADFGHEVTCVDKSAERIAALALRPWLYRITLNVYRNKVRGKRVSVVPLEASSESDGQTGSGRQEPQSSERERPEEATVQAELREELAALLAALPERYRAAVVLRYVEDLSYAELAETLEQPIGTVKTNVHRGIRQLRESLSGLADDGR